MTDSDNFAEGMREGHGLSDGCGEGILDKLDELDGSSSTKNRLSMTNVLVVSTLIPLGFPASESTTSKEPSGYTSTTLCKILPAMERSAKDGRDNGTSIGLMDSVGWTDGSIDGWLDTDDALEGASKMDGWSKGANDGILDKLGAFDGSSLVHEKDITNLQFASRNTNVNRDRIGFPPSKSVTSKYPSGLDSTTMLLESKRAIVTPAIRPPTNYC